jgi:hypothetical protein
MNFPFLAAKERLIRIMGTFDLATGHAETFNELLDSLESELRDVLGHDREQSKWVGLTDDEIHKIINDCTPDQAEQEELNDFARAVRFAEAKLKELNI